MSLSSISVALKMSFNNGFVEWVGFGKNKTKHTQVLIRKKCQKKHFGFMCPHLEDDSLILKCGESFR